MELSVYRWVRLADSTKLFMAEVWSANDGLVIGKGGTAYLADKIETLVTRLAADYLSANPPRKR
jgi:hypothetical protein